MRRPLLLPLVPLYAAGLWVKRRFAEPKRLAHPVVSVGSLSAGGAGKTPVVAALAELLERHGFGVDVLSRGYGRASRVVERVDPDGSAEQFGDEPLVLARRGLRVYVGADRYQAGMLAEHEASLSPKQNGTPVHLLDDGFQHRRLARALDVVLLTREDVADWLLPAGNLREPLKRLRGAGAVVLREEEEAELRPIVRRLTGEVPVWVTRRRLVVDGVSAQPLAFCGIARPKGFFAMLSKVGIQLAGEVSFADHHRYNDSDPYGLLDEARRLDADGFVTTEKDAVKLSRSMFGLLEARGPVVVARLQVRWMEEDRVMASISEACRRVIA